MYPNLNIPPNDQHFGLNKINGIKGYLVAEIKERELMRKRNILLNCVNILLLLTIFISH